MQIEHGERMADSLATVGIEEPPPAADPPTWVLGTLAVAYLVVLAAVVFLPGATLLERLRALDGGICAQAPSHSFFPGGEQLPLCSRNTGIYLGFACTVLVLLASGRMRAALFPARRVLVVLGLAVLFMAEDGFNSFFLDLGLPHLYQPHNLLRLASGLGAGVAMAAFIVPVANTLIWRVEDTRPSIGSFSQLAVIAPMLLLAFLAVGSQVAFLLYPIAVLSSLGLVLALTLVNVVFVLGVSGRVGRFTAWRQTVPFVTVAVATACLELMALFALKTSLMHALVSR